MCAIHPERNPVDTSIIVATLSTYTDRQTGKEAASQPPAALATVDLDISHY
jgi:hypothetical protein